ncbi:hypothetical protein Moror_1730 [Moniliophthora roreri MCA 2997]|uniref:BTB domain-containing protein n=1 Tax=Moniliophthora roreri (strain MCA 2997) TaxID=1381753 RepID=V2YP39_MONRO|nr:hypothetical protein Moror_1730 [Moniliophthora roreri MCA 2997]
MAHLPTSSFNGGDDSETDVLLSWLETSVTALFSATGPEITSLAADLPTPIEEDLLATGVQSPRHPSLGSDATAFHSSPLEPSSSSRSGQNLVPPPQQENPATISISHVFGPNIPEYVSRPPPDMILLTSDSVIFYVDEYTLLKVSDNHFHGLLPLQSKEKRERIVFVPAIHSSELQVVLQCLYDVSSIPLPDLDTILQGIDRLSVFGVAPKTVVKPTSRVFEHLLSCAPLHPIKIYTMAGFHDIYPLAVQVSAYLLVVDLSRVTEDIAERMGSKYLLNRAGTAHPH